MQSSPTARNPTRTTSKYRGSGKTTATSRGAAPGPAARPISSHVLDRPLRRVLIENTLPLWTQEEFYPSATCAAALSRLDQLVLEAHVQGIDTVRDLMAGAACLLSDLHDVEPAAMQAGPVAEQLHLDRNLLLGLAMSASLDAAEDPRRVAQQFLRLRTRTALHRRPSTDDEIVLCRSARNFTAGANTRGAMSGAAYVLLETGFGIVEIAGANDDDLVLDQSGRPTQVAACGMFSGAGVRASWRSLALDSFGQHTLERALQARASNPFPTRPQLLAYGGRSGGEDAAAGIKGSQDTLHRLLGLGDDLTAFSPALWRYRTVLLTQGPHAALAVSGSPTLDGLLSKLRGTTVI